VGGWARIYRLEPVASASGSAFAFFPVMLFQIQIGVMVIPFSVKPRAVQVQESREHASRQNFSRLFEPTPLQLRGE